jgi:hypothetical protein
MDDEGEAEAWMWRQKRRAALRILIVGLVVMIPSAIWLVAYIDYDVVDSPITRIRLIGGCFTTIGALLAITGGVLLARARRVRLPAARVL